MKKTTITSLTVAFVLLFAIASFAGPGRDGNRGPHNGGQGRMAQAVAQLTPEKRAAFEAIMEEHRKDTRPLRDAMWQKRTELQALSANPNTKPETLSGLVAEMAKIRATLQDKGDALRTRIEKEIGIDCPMGGFGFGDGPRGMGAGFPDGSRGMRCGVYYDMPR